MLCELCLSIFRELDHFIANSKETYINRNHQKSIESLATAAQNGCYMCFRALEKWRDAFADIDPLIMDDQETLLTWRAATTYEPIFVRICLSSDGESMAGQCSFKVIPAKWREDSFGFRFSRFETNAIRARHQSYDTIAPTTGSPSVGELAKHWYQQCRQGHVACCHPARPRSWYPPRLIDVRTHPTKLVLREHVSYGSDFAALSHCWGRETFLTLTPDRLADFQLHGIPHHELPVNFRNAIAACSALGIPYLWIDSLCIFQSGDTSYQDWARHVKIMERIYSECDVCISTAAANSATQSCFRERDVRVIEPAVATLRSEPHLLVAFDHAIQGFRNAPIASRAWVLQERLLSKRILTYGQHQVHWECTESKGHNVCETFPSGIETDIDIRGPFSLPSVPGDWVEDPKYYQDWIELIDLYSECQLTRTNEDKFAAFSGIAEHMQHVFNNSPYIAGFFAFEFPTCLLWHVRPSTRPDCRPPQDRLHYRAPTWSWAAADAPMKCYNPAYAMINSDLTQLASLTDSAVRLMEPDNPFSQLRWADISLCAPLLALTWEKQQNTDGEEETTYRMPGHEHSETLPSFHFDSLEDYEANQEDVSFLPIHGDGCVLSGLIVRLVPHGYGRRRRTREEEEQESEPTWRRIGMASTYDWDLFKTAIAAPKHNVILV
jgi:hypothetical protein